MLEKVCVRVCVWIEEREECVVYTEREVVFAHEGRKILNMTRNTA